MKKIVFLVLLSIVMYGASSQAEDAVSTPPTAAPENVTFTLDTKRDIRDTAPIKIKKVIDPSTLLSETGDIYALVGLDYPAITDKSPDVYKRLVELTEGKKCTVYRTRSDKIGRVNRMGQNLAHLTCGKDDLWVQGMLIAEGLARVRTTPENSSQSEKMLELEQKARDKKLGWWTLPSSTVLSPLTAGQRLNSFEIVEGKVYTTAQNREAIFLNFSPDWKTDFSIGIPSKLRKDFSKLRIDPLSLRGKTIRVRGWIRNYNGPYIELDHAQQLEIIADNKPATEPATEKIEKVIDALSAPSQKKDQPNEKMFMHTITGGKLPAEAITEPQEPTIEEPALPDVPKPTRPKISTPN